MDRWRCQPSRILAAVTSVARVTARAVEIAHVITVRDSIQSKPAQ
jgi:hypothetical protein